MIFQRSNTREVYKHSRRLLPPHISWKYGEQTVVGLHHMVALQKKQEEEDILQEQ